MTTQRIRQFQRLHGAWSQRKLAISVKLAGAQHQKTEILKAVQEVALLMQGDDQKDFKFEDFVNKHLVTLSQKLINVNSNLEILRFEHRDIAEKERQVEKLSVNLEFELEKDQASAELMEVLEYVVISDFANFRKLATSQM
jgi:hypothetical protein